MYIIDANNIIKDYTNHRALNDVSIQIPRGSIYGLLGPNGAGKTTFIRVLNHITAPDSGTILFNGRNMKPDDVMRIGYLPEERGLYKKMKVGEQAIYLSRLKGLSKHDAHTSLRKWFKKFEIDNWWNRSVSDLSKGMAQKIQFIVTVIHKPELLIFDEPFSGFDPINANLLKSEIINLAKEGATVIFSTHNMTSVEEICDHITLINKSRNVLSGSIDQIRKTYGSNKYSLEFVGSADTLMPELEQLCVVAYEKQNKPLQKLILTPHEGVSTREILTLTNPVVDIHSFRELTPSMSDIFIKTVESTNLEFNNTCHE